MRHVPPPAFLADKLRRDVIPALREIQNVAQAEPGLARDVAKVLAPVQTRLSKLAGLCGLHADTTDPVRTAEKIADTLAARVPLDFRALPSFQSFYRGMGERIWTCATSLFAATNHALGEAHRLDPALYERYLRLDLSFPELTFKAD